MDQAKSGFAVLFTGLPLSGKTVIMQKMCQILSEQGIMIVHFDSDKPRRILTMHLFICMKNGTGFYSVLVYLAEHLTESGVNVAMSATAPRRFYRATARLHIEKFAEVFVYCPETLCRTRDPKGLWKKVENKVKSEIFPVLAYLTKDHRYRRYIWRRRIHPYQAEPIRYLRGLRDSVS